MLEQPDSCIQLKLAVDRVCCPPWPGRSIGLNAMTAPLEDTVASQLFIVVVILLLYVLRYIIRHFMDNHIVHDINGWKKLLRIWRVHCLHLGYGLQWTQWEHEKCDHLPQYLVKAPSVKCVFSVCTCVLLEEYCNIAAKAEPKRQLADVWQWERTQSPVLPVPQLYSANRHVWVNTNLRRLIPLFEVFV